MSKENRGLTLREEIDKLVMDIKIVEDSLEGYQKITRSQIAGEPSSYDHPAKVAAVNKLKVDMAALRKTTLYIDKMIEATKYA